MKIMDKSLQKFKKIDPHYLILFILIFIALIIGIIQLQTPMLAEADAHSRANLALKNYLQGVIYQKRFGAWLPLHFSLLTLSFYFIKNIYLAPRILTLIFNLLSMIALFEYSNLINKNKKISLLVVFIYLIFPIRIITAAQTLSEPIFIFFFISALYLLLREKPNYLLSIILLNIAQGIRFEAWLILPFVFLSIIVNKKLRRKEKLIYILSYSFFPIYWLINNYCVYGHPLHFLKIKADTAQHYFSSRYGNFLFSFMSWWVRLKINFQQILIITSLIPCRKCFDKKKNISEKIIYLLPIYFFLILVFQVYFGTMEWEPYRYLYVPIVLLIPNLGYSILLIANWLKKKFKFNKRKTIILLMVIVISLNIGHFVKNFKSIDKIMNFHIYLRKTELQNLIDEFEIISNKQDEAYQVKYFYNEKLLERFWLDQAFYYFANNNIKNRYYQGNIFNKEQIAKESQKENSIIIWEKGPNDQEWEIDKYLTVIYESDSFLILGKKPY